MAIERSFLHARPMTGINSQHSDLQVGIGLPNTIPGVAGQLLVGWARHAEERGFSTIGTVDRVVYDSYDPLIALAAAAAITNRIGLTTSVLIGPVRPTAILAKQAASLDRVSGGRLTLGLGLGGRADDYAAVGLPTAGRGQMFDEQLAALRRIWAATDGIGPTPARAGGPRMLIGGSPAVAAERVARHADGWTMTLTSFAEFAAGRQVVDAAWAEHRRQGRPFCQALFYFALGPGAAQVASEVIRSYYGWLGAEVADQVAAGAAITASMVETYIGGLADAGADEIIAVPCVPELDQIDALADTVAGVSSPAAPSSRLSNKAPGKEQP
jgi:alkanesulfonate monooxygenase SsuD/methylene tetrahydromethanopterin reductase-like flavin-dependent oxidoreductase (luciferase family)